MNQTPEAERGPVLPTEMTPTEFREAGYLQEINRRFLHPLGLALAMAVDRETETATGEFRIWDIRDEDAEGFTFTEWTEIDRKRAARIEIELNQALKFRERQIGFGVQPI